MQRQRPPQLHRIIITMTIIMPSTITIITTTITPSTSTAIIPWQRRPPPLQFQL